MMKAMTSCLVHTRARKEVRNEYLMILRRLPRWECVVYTKLQNPVPIICMHWRVMVLLSLLLGYNTV